MFNTFLTALIQKIVIHLDGHKDFFKLEEKERKENLAKLSIPTAFKTYLEESSEEKFMHDLKVIVTFIQSPKETKILHNKFFESLGEFLVTDLARKIDLLNGDYYLSSGEERTEIVDKLINSDSDLAQALKEILINSTYQQIAAGIVEICSKIKKVPYILIQSPREVDAELKKEIRTKFQEEHDLSFPVFQINKKIIGGMRIFQDGETVDESWLSRVLRFTSLTSA